MTECTDSQYEDVAPTYTSDRGVSSPDRYTYTHTHIHTDIDTHTDTQTHR